MVKIKPIFIKKTRIMTSENIKLLHCKFNIQLFIDYTNQSL